LRLPEPWLSLFSLDHAVNWEAISAIGQLVGALAVVISLIYLAREVRSNSRATGLASMRTMSDAINRWAQQLAEHPQLRELYYRGIHDFESLEGADVVGFSALMAASAVGGGGCTRVAWVGSGHARLQRISWSSGLVAYTLALVL
jgi:hypothetical protein